MFTYTTVLAPIALAKRPLVRVGIGLRRGSMRSSTFPDGRQSFVPKLGGPRPKARLPCRTEPCAPENGGGRPREYIPGAPRSVDSA